MKELFMAPVVVALLLGTLAELEELGEQTRDRTVQYAEDAVAALDCAYTARPLTDCAPDIIGPSFDEELEQAKRITQQLQAANHP